MNHNVLRRFLRTIENSIHRDFHFKGIWVIREKHVTMSVVSLNTEKSVKMSEYVGDFHKPLRFLSLLCRTEMFLFLGFKIDRKNCVYKS